MKIILGLVLMSLSAMSSACIEIAGTYKSASETHWSYTIIIDGNDLKVGYSNYWYIEDKKYETSSSFSGYCEKSGGKYLLKYNEKEVTVAFDPKLTLPGVGETKSLPGIIGKLEDGEVLSLWEFN